MSDVITFINSHNVSNLIYHFVTTVENAGSKEVACKYVQNQDKQDEYEQLLFKF